MSEPSSETVTTVSVLGLGRIGAPLAACLAARGLDVIGVDVDRGKVDALDAGRAPVCEPGLAELVEQARGTLRATVSLSQAVLESEITFVALPTPPEPDGSLSVRYLLPACAEIGEALRAKPGFHSVAVVSTVMPGTTGGVLSATIAEASAREAVTGFGICFAPEFVALGTAIRDYLSPDFVLIGASDRRSADLVESVLRRACDNDPPIVRTSLVAAELAKLALNAFLATKVSFANVLAQIAEGLPGCQIDAVTAAIELDHRVGRGYLSGGMSFGGPCLPRDTAALAALARGSGAPAGLAEAAIEVNEEVLGRLVALVREHLPQGGCLGICGLSFKPGTDVVEASPAVALGRRLAGDGARVVGFDPLVHAPPDPAIELAPSLERCVADADVVVIATPCDEFRGLDALPGNGDGRHRTVIDGWRILKGACLERADYIAPGCG